MAITPLSSGQVFLPAALRDADVMSLDPETAAALGALLNLSLSSDTQLAATAQRTATEFESFIRQLKEQAADLQTRNQRLREQLAKKMREKRGVEQLHAEQVDPLKIKVAAAKEAVERMRHEVAASAAKADRRVAAAIAEEAAGVQTITQKTDREVGVINSRCETQLASASNTYCNERDSMQRRYDKEFKRLNDLVGPVFDRFHSAACSNMRKPSDAARLCEHILQGWL